MAGAYYLLSIFFLPLPCYSLNMSKAECAFICCLSSLNKPLPTCVPPQDEKREWGRVECISDHCLVHAVTYDKFSVPHGMEHLDHGVSHGNPDDPCPAKDVNHTTFGNHSQPLEVKLEVTIHSITDIRLDESSVTTSMMVKMAWSDPHLDICSCHHETASHEGTRMMVSGDMEDTIWVPDLTIWDHLSFEREEGLTYEKLNKIYVKNQHEGVQVDMTFDMKAVTHCHFNTSFYPFDRNMCKVQLGSYNNKDDKIQFMMEENGLKSFGLIYSDHEYTIELFHLAGEDAALLYEGDTYIYAGFKFHMVRNHEKIQSQFVVTMTVMVMMALGSSLIPTGEEENFGIDRTGLLSGSLISSILIFQFAIRNSPSSSDLSLTPLITYILISLCFIGVSFLQYCFISVSWFQLEWRRRIDLAFFFLSTVSYIMFVSLYWQLKYEEAVELACHNAVS